MQLFLLREALNSAMHKGVFNGAKKNKKALQVICENILQNRYNKTI